MENRYLQKGTKWTRSSNQYDPLKAGSIDGTDTEPHDHGIVRALNAEYYPDRSVKGKAKCTIFISNLHKKTNEKLIKKVFLKFGRIQRCRIVRDVVTGASKCYGFVEYHSEESAKRAYSENKKLIIDGYLIFVDFECERSLPGWIPRRLGGGFGGKKESGQLRFGGRYRHFKQPLQSGPTSSQDNTVLEEPDIDMIDELDDGPEDERNSSSSDSYKINFWKSYYNKLP